MEGSARSDLEFRAAVRHLYSSNRDPEQDEQFRSSNGSDHCCWTKWCLQNGQRSNGPYHPCTTSGAQLADQAAHYCGWRLRYRLLPSPRYGLLQNTAVQLLVRHRSEEHTSGTPV